MVTFYIKSEINSGILLDGIVKLLFPLFSLLKNNV